MHLLGPELRKFFEKSVASAELHRPKSKKRRVQLIEYLPSKTQMNGQRHVLPMRQQQGPDPRRILPVTSFFSAGREAFFWSRFSRTSSHNPRHLLLHTLWRTSTREAASHKGLAPALSLAKMWRPRLSAQNILQKHKLTPSCLATCLGLVVCCFFSG